MAVTKRVDVDLIEPVGNGVLSVRLAKLAWRDGEFVSGEWHRVTIEPGADVETILSETNASLATMDEPPVAPGEWDRVRGEVKNAHTPDVVTAHRAAREASRLAEVEELRLANEEAVKDMPKGLTKKL